MPNPTGIGSGLQFWATGNSGVFKDAGTIPAVNSDTVQQWNDGAALRNLSQATGGNRPTYIAPDLNGYNGLRFAAAARMSATGPTNIGAAFTLEFVFKITTDTNQSFVQIHNGTNSAGFQIWYVTGSQILEIVFAGLTTHAFNLTVSTNTLYRAIITCTGNFGTATLYLRAQGGSEVSHAISVSTMTNTTNQTWVGDGLFGQSLIGDLLDVAVYNNALTGTDLTNLKAWGDGFFVVGPRGRKTMNRRTGSRSPIAA